MSTNHISLQKYLIKKGIINFWLVNAIINAVIFFFMTSDKTQMFSVNQIALDYLTSLLVLGMACALTGFPMIRKDIDKGIAPDTIMDRNDYLIAHLFPKSNILKSIILTILVIIIIIPFFAGLPAIFGIFHLNFAQALILKTIATGFAGLIVGYFVMILTLCGYKGKQVIQ